MTSYGINARDYLRRARERLDEQRQESLFYAAFELRAGIEARLQQYLEAHKDLQKRRKRGWRVSKLGKEAERAFRTGDMVRRLTITDLETGAVSFVGFYTPVTKKLRKMAERLGELLHCAKGLDDDDDEWWERTRHVAEEVYRELATACAGTILGPPMYHAGTRRAHMYTEVLGETSKEPSMRRGRDYLVELAEVEASEVTGG